MKRKIAKISSIVVALAVAIVVVHTVLALHPSKLFRHKTDFGDISVYSAKPIPYGFDDTLLRAKELVEGSALSWADSDIRVILSHGHFYNRFFGRPEIAYANHYNAVLSGVINPADNSLSWGKSGVRMNLITTLAHEMVHCLQGQHHGFIPFNLTEKQPLWKKEGYAEYVSQREMREARGYSFSKEIERLVDSESTRSLPGWITQSDGFDRPLIYFRSRLLTEYLFEVEGTSYEAFVQQEIDENELFDRMMEWYGERAEQIASPNADKPRG